MDQTTIASEKELYSTELYSLLRDRLPSEHVYEGRINTRSLAKVTGNARFTIYRWLHEGRLSPKAIQALIKVSAEASRPEERDRLTKNDLYPFLPIN